jgi:conjugal transfer pilus assembly protein TraE
MKISSFLKTWEGALAENRWSRIVNLLLLVSVILLAIRAFTTETVVTMQPVTLTEEAQLTSNTASASYHEAWGLFLATFLGNATPDNSTFIRERIGPLLSPSIYHEVMAVIEEQTQHISNDRVSIRFEPRYVLYEKESGHTYVNGNSYIKDATTKETREESTYEFRLKIQRYQPTIDFVNLYPGKPRSEKVLQQMQQREAKIKEKERKKR